LTQRKLTADEQEVVYNLMRSLNRAALLIDAKGSAAEMIRHAGGLVRNGTTDGLPLTPLERVPTAADVGKSVKVRSNETNPWWGPCYFVGVRRDRLFVVESPSGNVTTWAICVIDEEADQ